MNLLTYSSGDYDNQREYLLTWDPRFWLYLTVEIIFQRGDYLPDPIELGFRIQFRGCIQICFQTAHESLNQAWIV